MPLRSDPKLDERVAAWDHTFRWTSQHPNRDELWPMKFKIDEVGANAYARCLEIFNEQQVPNADSKEPITKPNVYNILVENANKDPVLQNLWQQVNTTPDWVDWDQLARGQAAFNRYGLSSYACLTYQSLLGGFGAARLVETLVRTGGFSPKIARRRLYETTQWVLEVTRSLENIKPGGDGWKSTVQVRLLHAAVRNRIMKITETRPDYYNVEELGMPVNDFDAAGTISSFSGQLVWLGLPRQGIYMRQNEIVDYIALWRYIAYVIGSPTHFFETPEKARVLQDSIMYFEIEPTDTSRTLAMTLVKALVDIPPMHPTADSIVTGARWLNGNKLCDALGLHRPGFLEKARLGLRLGYLAVMTYTVRNIRFLDEWQIEYVKRLLWDSVVESKHTLAGKKTDFQFTYVPSYGSLPALKQLDAQAFGGRNLSVLGGVFVLVLALGAAAITGVYLHGGSGAAAIRSFV